MKLHYLATLLAILLFSTSCTPDRSTDHSEHIETAEEVYSLNNETASDDVPLVSAVSAVVTDSEQNIYLVDPRTLQIHSYTRDMGYRWTTGGQGSGPEKFNRISALYADHEYLYAYDGSNATISQFTLGGERVQEWTFGESGHDLNHIRRMGGGKFITTGWNRDSQTLVQFYSDTFENRETGVVTVGETAHFDHPDLVGEIFSLYPGAAAPIDSSSFLYAPAAYGGELMIYRQGTGDQWELAETVAGYERIDTPMAIHLSSDGNYERSHGSGFNPSGGYYHTEFSSMSNGLYRHQNGQIVHLSTRQNENDNWDLVMEYFDPDDFELSGYSVVKDWNEGFEFKRMPIWMDETGRIYVTENSDVPLRIIRVNPAP